MRSLSVLPFVGALALAGCGVSGSQPATTSHLPSRPAAVTASDHVVRSHDPVRHAGRTITTRRSQYGRLLIDQTDRTIYLFTRDRSITSECYGACSVAWPPVLTTAAPIARGGLLKHVGTTRRRDGRLQVTYNGHPLYYYVNDVKPGQILCQNVQEFGGTWLVVSPQGTAIR
jgi:predicted lipoprotein with Yx(FWY)xxD motif